MIRLSALSHRLLITCVTALCLSTAAVGQILQGPWVEQTNQRIDQHRRNDVRIIILNRQGQPAAGARVRIEQLRHDFTIGFVADAEGLDGILWDQPLWRCFNAVALDRVTAWPAVQPREGWEFETVDAMLGAAQQHGLTVRWGGVLSADIGRVPGWIAELNDEALRRAAEDHLVKVLNRYGTRMDQFDIYTHSLDHTLFSPAVVRRFYEHAQALAPRATMCIRFEDTLTEARVQDMIQRIMTMKQSFIPVEAISIEQRIGGILLQAPLARTLDAMGSLGSEIILGSIEISGASEAAAAVNLETFLRTAFAHPRVTGIYFAGITADELVDPSGALISAFGFPTEAGQTLDDLFHGLWRTDTEHTADELGNVRTRVFAGSHHITATLEDGTRIDTTVHVAPPAPEQESRVILLEPVGDARPLQRRGE